MLKTFLKKENIQFLPESLQDKYDIIRYLINKADDIPWTEKEDIYDELAARVNSFLRVAGYGFLIPHGQISGKQGIDLLIGISRDGFKWDEEDEKISHVVLLILAGDDPAYSYMAMLAESVQLARQEGLLAALARAGDAGEVYSILMKESRREDG